MITQIGHDQIGITGHSPGITGHTLLGMTGHDGSESAISPCGNVHLARFHVLSQGGAGGTAFERLPDISFVVVIQIEVPDAGRGL